MEIRGGRGHAESWINNVFDDQNCDAVGECLTAIENLLSWEGGSARPLTTGINVIREGKSYRLYRVSGGQHGSNKNCTLFFIRDEMMDAASVIGVYQHMQENQYRKEWTHVDNPYDMSPVIRLP